MNQELKNFDILIVELEKTFKYGEYQAFKTLLSIYSDIYNNFDKLKFKDIYTNGLGEILVKHHDKLKHFEHNFITEVFPKMTTQGEYKALHTIQFLIDKLKEINHYMGKKVEDYLKGKEVNEALVRGLNNSESLNLAKDLLNKSVKGRFLVTQVGDDLRNTGKTTALIKKANETGATIVVGRHSTKRFVDEESRKLGYKIDCQYISDQANIRGRRFKNKKFLVDDSTSNVAIRELIKQGNEFLGGFNSLNDSLTMLKQPTLLDRLYDKLNKLINERDILNATYLDDAPNISAWMLVNKKIELINELIREEKMGEIKSEFDKFENKVNTKLESLDIPWD